MTNVLTPFRRDKKNDFAHGDGADLLATKVRQVLATRGPGTKSQGEVPWRTDFGSPLHLLRHQRNDTILKELARIYVRDALRKWLPRVELTGIDVSSENAMIVVSVRVSGADTDTRVEV